MATCEAEEMRHLSGAAMCAHACICISSPSPLVVVPILYSCLTFRVEVSWEWALWSGAGSCCQCASCVLFISSRVRMCLHVLLFEHAQLPLLFSSGGPVPGEFTREDFLVVGIPCHLSWCCGRVASSSAAPALLCWTQLMLQVLLV